MSTLTPEDEVRYAKVFLKLIAAVLDSVPTAYAINVELSDGEVLRLPEAESAHAEPASFV